MKEQHIVPLAHQAVTILRELHALTGWGEYVFPSLLTLERPMRNKVRAAYNKAQRIPERRNMMQAWRRTTLKRCGERLGVR